MATTPEAATERLVQLGFSTSETRTYVGLLGTATGYAVANVCRSPSSTRRCGASRTAVPSPPPSGPPDS
jgi:hypothetical protein